MAIRLKDKVCQEVERG